MSIRDVAAEAPDACAEPRAEPGRVERGAEHAGSGRPSLAVADARSERRHRPPALVAELVELVLEDEKAALAEEREPALLVELDVPVRLLALAARDAREQPAAPVE